MLLEDMKNMSSIVFEVIRTILGLFIFLWKDFECQKSTKTQKKRFSLRSFYAHKKLLRLLFFIRLFLFC